MGRRTIDAHDPSGPSGHLPSFAGEESQVPIVVRSWNQCWACTYDLILGDSACGLVSCTTQISTASSTTFSCTLANKASCLAASNVVRTSLISASIAGFE